jgi:hypothetical protein
MASPHVAGVAALIRQLDPNLTPAEVTRVIEIQALAGVLTNVGPSSPNLLLQVPPLTCVLPAIPPPTDAPTLAPTSCIDIFRLEVLFDNYPQETSWDLKTPSGSMIASGSGYDNMSSYAENVCLDDGVYTFTIYDSYGDGICCRYGLGSYSILFNGVPVALDNLDFTSSSESTSFGEEKTSSKPSRVPSVWPSVEPSTSVLPTSPPTMFPSDRPSTSPSPAPTDPPTTTLPPAPSWTEIFSEYFEAGLGNFNKGGNDAGLSTRYSHNGSSKSAYIQDDSNQKSSVYSNFFPVSSYSKIKVEFWYLSESYDDNDNFCLETDNGSGVWSTVYTWVYGEHFNQNSNWSSASIIMPVSSSSSELRIRFRNNSDGNSKKIYIDEVAVSGE